LSYQWSEFLKRQIVGSESPKNAGAWLLKRKKLNVSGKTGAGLGCRVPGAELFYGGNGIPRK
jgi:hypothetical protein